MVNGNFNSREIAPNSQNRAIHGNQLKSSQSCISTEGQDTERLVWEAQPAQLNAMSAVLGILNKDACSIAQAHMKMLSRHGLQNNTQHQML